MKKTRQSIPFYRKKVFLWSAGSVVGLALIVVLAFRLSPWPGAMVIRTVFNRGGHKTLMGLQKSIPPQAVTVLANQQYGADKKEKLDVYIPKSAINAHQNLPTVIWTHGGAWLSGDKKDSAPYYNLLAAQGYVVVALDYSLAPESSYPTAIHQLNAAHAYLEAHATSLHINPDKVVLAGDSAGAQLSSQMAALITNPSYAQTVGIHPALRPNQLAGVVLYCGIYKMEGLTQPDPTLPKIVGWGNDVTVWAYSGTRDKSDALIRQMSPYYYATKDFPATFISGGNSDPLTNAQSKPLAQELTSLGVPVNTLFYPENHTPGLPHEYQFTFNNDGKQAFTQTVQFLQDKTR